MAQAASYCLLARRIRFGTLSLQLSRSATRRPDDLLLEDYQGLMVEWWDTGDAFEAFATEGLSVAAEEDARCSHIYSRYL